MIFCVLSGTSWSNIFLTQKYSSDLYAEMDGDVIGTSIGFSVKIEIQPPPPHLINKCKTVWIVYRFPPSQSNKILHLPIQSVQVEYTSQL